MENRLFNTWLNRWGLTPDGEPVETHTSQLLPVVVIRDGQKAILKITDDDSERIGCELMVWWNGNGAAKVLAHAAGAILLERATGTGSLADMSWTGNDAQACRIICHAASRLHFSRNASTPALTPLHHWFSDLAPAAKKHGGILTRCAVVANVLLSSPMMKSYYTVTYTTAIFLISEREDGWLSIPKGCWASVALITPIFLLTLILPNPPDLLPLNRKHSHNESTLCLKSQELNGNVC